MEDATALAALDEAGRRCFAGFRLDSRGRVESTQDVVREAARAGATAGYVCLAAVQSAGRGRQGRAWEAEEGSALLASILVRAAHDRLGLVPIAAGLALRAAIEDASGFAARLKWPNDLLAGRRKLAGVLCEVEPGAGGVGTAIAVGLGVNLREGRLPEGAVSLDAVAEASPAPAALLAAILPQLADRLARLDRGDIAGLRREWLAHAAGVGEPVRATASGRAAVEGVIEGIDDDGALLVRQPAGVRRLLAGDVHLGGIPPPG